MRGNQSVPNFSRLNTTKLPVAVLPLEELAGIELHYNKRENSGVIDILNAIAQELSCNEYLHSWDDKLIADPVKALALCAKKELKRSGIETGNHTVNFGHVEEVATRNGFNERCHAVRDASNVRSHFFPSEIEIRDQRTNGPSSNGCTSLPRYSQGRIAYTRELLNAAQRATLLMLHVFCLRLQDEDFSFICNFIRRHLSLRTMSREPYHFQDVSSAFGGPISQKCYKRVTLSFHLPHLLLQPQEDSLDDGEVSDREWLGRFRPDQNALVEEKGFCLYRSSSSVLLTAVRPEEQTSRQEAHELLGNPEALWTVVMVNSPRLFTTGAYQDPPELMTPLAQFTRGVFTTVNSQRLHIGPILEEMKAQLQASGTDILFDDQNFSKTRLYHWIIKTCHEICGSIDSNSRYVQRFQKGVLASLQAKAHPYERLGLDHWNNRLNEEISELEALGAEVHTFREQVRELRDALHGATSVLESRSALMQGERVKVLSYLGMAYLPVSTAASLYSMAVLPKAATLQSFCIFAAIMLITTIFFSLNLHNIISRYFIRSQSDNQRGFHLTIRHTRTTGSLEKDQRSTRRIWLKNCSIFIAKLIMSYLQNIWTRSSKAFADANLSANRKARNKRPRVLFVIYYMIQAGIAFLFGNLLRIAAKETSYGFSLLCRPVSTPLYTTRFSLAKFFGDVLRFFLTPVWLAFLVLVGIAWLAFFILVILGNLVKKLTSPLILICAPFYNKLSKRKSSQRRYVPWKRQNYPGRSPGFVRSQQNRAVMKNTFTTSTPRVVEIDLAPQTTLGTVQDPRRSGDVWMDIVVRTETEVQRSSFEL